MPVLANSRHERFAQAIAIGKPRIEAHAEAGFKPDDGNASKLAARPEVQARIQEITGKAAENAGLKAEQVIGELQKLAFANMMDFIQIGPDGLPYTDFSKLSREQAAAIAEIIVETTPAAIGDAGEIVRPEVNKVRFKLADKRGPLTDLGKYLDLFVAHHQHEHTGKVELSSARERSASRIARLSARRPTGSGAARSKRGRGRKT